MPLFWMTTETVMRWPGLRVKGSVPSGAMRLRLVCRRARSGSIAKMSTLKHVVLEEAQ